MKKVLKIAVLFVLLGAFAFCMAKIATPHIESEMEEQKFDVLTEETDDTDNLCKQYQALLEQNADFFGWIKIDGTHIDYPVMRYCNDFYLRHNFQKEYSRSGTPYISENSEYNRDNILIYGHNMKTDTMFHDLTKYADKDFFEKHKIVHFNTPFEIADYEVVYAFKTVAYSEYGFDYYSYDGFLTEEQFNKFNEGCKKLSLYDTGTEISYTDNLITLSTCEYSRYNGRFVIVARKMR